MLDGELYYLLQDPDAPLREHRPLADLDQDDESRLLRYLFAFVRAGQIDEVMRIYKLLFTCAFLEHPKCMK